MSRFRVALLAVAAGGLAGVLVLGVGGRLLMAVLVLLAGGHPSFSPGGSLKVISVGTGYGAVGGLLLLLVSWRTGRQRLAGALLGLLLFAVAWLTSPVGRAAAAGRLPRVLGLAVPAFMIWGLVAAALLARWQLQRGVRRAAAP
jgi:hypothetical protein